MESRAARFILRKLDFTTTIRPAPPLFGSQPRASRKAKAAVKGDPATWPQNTSDGEMLWKFARAKCRRLNDLLRDDIGEGSAFVRDEGPPAGTGGGRSDSAATGAGP
jgi:hypothetical protein